MMSHRLIVCALALAVAACGDDRSAPSGARAPAELRAHRHEFRKEVVRVTEGVYVAVGYGLANVVVLEGPRGLVVIDTLESAAAAREALGALNRVVRKPVVAVVLTHHHADHVFGTGVFTGGGKVPVWAHAEALPLMDRFMALTREVTYRRAMRMYGTQLPDDERVTSGIGPCLRFGAAEELALVRPTNTFSGDRARVRAAGLDLELLHAPGETTDQIVVWLPARRVLVCADNYYRSFPNLYTIRGAPYRDPVQWASSIRMMRDLRPEHLVPCHTRPLSGAAHVRRVLADYMDAVKYVHDQTLRGINRGLGPDELAETVKLPVHLAGQPWLREYYGRVAWSVRAIYHGYLGWFDGNAANLDPLPPRERAAAMARLAGGTGALLAKARQALDEGDHRWAIVLADSLLALEPGHRDAARLKAAALRKQVAGDINANARNYCLTQARELEGRISIAPQVVPRDMLPRIPLASIFAAMCLRVDPVKSAGVDTTVLFRFKDTGERYYLELRRGVAWVGHQGNRPAVTVTTTAPVWKEIVTRLRNPALALARGDLAVSGSLTTFWSAMRCFEQ